MNVNEPGIYQNGFRITRHQITSFRLLTLAEGYTKISNSSTPEL